MCQSFVFHEAPPKHTVIRMIIAFLSWQAWNSISVLVWFVLPQEWDWALYLLPFNYLLLWTVYKYIFFIKIIFYYTCEVEVSQSCPILCNPIDYTVHGMLQIRILEWVAYPFSSGSSQPRNRTEVSCIAGGFFTSWATRGSVFLYQLGIVILLRLCVCAQLCPTLCDPTGGSPPGFSVHGVFQARI